MKDNIIVKIDNIDSINNINDNTKYININIDSVSDDIVNYFIDNGKRYSYADTVNNIGGFIYTPFAIFCSGEKIIKKILNNKINKFNKLELVRYIYISLGKMLFTSYDDNNFSDISNIWEAFDKRFINNLSICKIFCYLLRRVDIKSELVSSGINGTIVCKVNVDDKTLILDLYNDMYNIQGGFKTEYFDKYNDIKDIDKKIGYISDEYMNYYVNDALKDVDVNDILKDILKRTETMLDINNIGTCELGKIYAELFKKYAHGYDIKVSNLFVFDKKLGREHFIVFSYDNQIYSYNYNKGCFILVDKSILLTNFNNEKIGFYNAEDYLFGEKGMVM